MFCVTILSDNRGNNSQLICADIRVDIFLTQKRSQPLAMACPGLMEIEEDVFESFKDDEREVPGVIRHRFKR